MRFYELESVPYGTVRYTGEYRAEHKWKLPGLQCPTCGGNAAGIAEAYPSVDLSAFPAAKQLEKTWLEKDSGKFEHLRQMVRPLVPASARLRPGTHFGPLVGSARGTFAQLLIQDPWLVLIRREALEQLQAEGLRGLKGCRTELRFRQRSAPELLELEIELHGLYHPDCLPPVTLEPCKTCGSYKFGRPKQPLLDGTSLPEQLDVFRLRNGAATLVITQRFADTLHRLGFEEYSLRELPVR
jgi:uncharacterized double-CXXCG motif protein